jgi:hypothetical protein
MVRGTGLNQAVGEELGADLVEKRGEVAHELERRFLDVLLVAALVRLEPVPVVVPAQVEEECEEIRRGGGVLDHELVPITKAGAP